MPSVVLTVDLWQIVIGPVRTVIKVHFGINFVEYLLIIFLAQIMSATILGLLIRQPFVRARLSLKQVIAVRRDWLPARKVVAQSVTATLAVLAVVRSGATVHAAWRLVLPLLT